MASGRRPDECLSQTRAQRESLDSANEPLGLFFFWVLVEGRIQCVLLLWAREKDSIDPFLFFLTLIIT